MVLRSRRAFTRLFDSARRLPRRPTNVTRARRPATDRRIAAARHVPRTFVGPPFLVTDARV